LQKSFDFQKKKQYTFPIVLLFFVMKYLSIFLIVFLSFGSSSFAFTSKDGTFLDV